MAPARLLALLAKFTNGILIVPDAALSVRSWRVALGRCDGVARLWLFARSDDALVKVLRRAPRVCVTMHTVQASASIVGTARRVVDKRQVDALWGGAVDRDYLFPLGGEREALLLRVDSSRVDVWAPDRRESLSSAVAAIRNVFDRGPQETSHALEV